MDGWTFITWSRFKNKSSSFNFHWEKKIKGIDGLQINFLSQNTLFLFYKKLKMNLLKIRGWNWFFWCVSVKCFGFRQCQLARCLLWKMRTAALLSLLSHTRHDFAIFVSCFFILSRFITVVFCIFQYSILKWINCSRFFVVFFFFFCHHLPISQFSLLIHFLISWVFVIRYILQEKLGVLYSLRSFFLKYVCFYLHDTMPGKIFFGPTYFTPELCFTFPHQFSGTEYCCGEECDANLSLFFLLYMIWSFAFENSSSSTSELEVSWGWDFLI